ncbi:hypothetical protein [uncultured Clostridium sp.]|uniref:hypothetical protein n=1 Tax=uncultured Clostridium sp. TaxID=59620 RepID=UPI002637D134|nr:hypothetical protein [uncultured Clostridium sp.]
MWWLNAENEKDLRKLTKERYKTRQLENLKREINSDIDKFLEGNGLDVGPKNSKKIVARGWSELYSKILRIKEFYLNLQSKNSNEEIEKKRGENTKTVEIEYFKSRSDELIFYILELSGKNRNEKLGVKESFYRNKRQGKTWRNKILKEIHPDVCTNERANEAIHAFEQLCELIIK